MPPALGFALAYPIWTGLTFLLPHGIGQGVVSGAMTGFVLYDLMHCMFCSSDFLHHGKPFLSHFKEMKTYHLDHHYKNANLGYGITSKFWDYVFSTIL
jgi:4-hydroxysphinganine ceramide fatty acyl 2-hydroxylase